MSAPRNITVLFFAAVRELVSEDEVKLEVPPDVCTIQQLSAWLEARFPALAGRMQSVRLARNEAFADAHEAIEDGDVIALIPPVAGG
jgi:molybdopterin synthase sulfur carrier subunit